MKKVTLTLLSFFAFLNLFSQYESPVQQESSEYTNCVTIGILQGGGSLLGADLEVLVTKQVGLQAGLGLVGYGAGLNFHFKPSIRSSFLSITYWNQGIGNSFAQNLVGGSYVFRGKKWFTCQIGLGIPLSTGPAMPENYEMPPIMLIYSIGGYIPF